MKNIAKITGIVAYFGFILISSIVGFTPGKQVSKNFIEFSIYMLELLPCAFVLIGLFDVWVKRETVEKYFGKESGIKGYIGAILLGGTAVGGSLLIAFPFAYSLYNKGAKLSVIFTYIGAAGICKIPMTIFEITFMGIKFSAIRLLVSIPLVVISSIFLGDYLEKRNYKIMEGK